MFQKTSGIEKFWGEKNRGHHNFPSKNWCLTVAKNIVGETFRVSEKKTDIEKFYG